MDALVRHVELSVAALGIALAVAGPLGIVIARRPGLGLGSRVVAGTGAGAGATKAVGRGPGPGPSPGSEPVSRLAETVIALFSGARVVPSLAILFLAVPILGIGFAPALLALTVLACPPILLNTYAAFRGVEATVIEAARGMGMSTAQVFRRIEAPLAMPVIITGVRTAAVEVISSATLAAFIGAGGLGDFITLGFALDRPEVMLVGAVPVAALALISEAGLSAIEHRLQVA